MYALLIAHFNIWKFINLFFGNTKLTLFKNFKIYRKYLAKSFSITPVSHLLRFLYSSPEVITIVNFFYILANYDMQGYMNIVYLP